MIQIFAPIDSFMENVSWKMTHFLENNIAETNSGRCVDKL